MRQLLNALIKLIRFNAETYNYEIENDFSMLKEK